MKTIMHKPVRIIDLFAGMGGIRKGLELALAERGLQSVCVFTSEIKPAAIKILRQNHPEDEIRGDITTVPTSDIPDFDILCAGFPCQAFSYAGKRLGFADTRGTLFFEVERILREKQPAGFILENVEGLLTHDHGNTLATMLSRLNALGYKVAYNVLNSRYFGVAQERKRIYIVGNRNEKADLVAFKPQKAVLGDILETGKPVSDTPFVRNLLAKFSVEQLYGKAIKDKRGGENNIHSWDLETKGPTTVEERALLNVMLTERRKKKWAEQYGIAWMDGMTLTEEMIRTFCDMPNLHETLDGLVRKGYLAYEHPKRQVREISENGTPVLRREQDTSLPKGYNIVAGKLSFEIAKILSPKELAPTLVAMDMQKLYVVDGKGLRRLTLREGLRLFGYPEDFKFDISEKEGYDLLGNTVVVPVIKAVAGKLLDKIL